MADTLASIEYPYLIMVAGAVLLAIGILGLIFRRNGPAWRWKDLQPWTGSGAKGV